MAELAKLREPLDQIKQKVNSVEAVASTDHNYKQELVDEYKAKEVE